MKLSKKSKILLDPTKRASLIDYLSKQKRFSKLSEKDLIKLQERIDHNWDQINIELNCQENYTK